MHEYISMTMSTTMKFSNDDADDDNWSSDHDYEDYDHVEDRHIKNERIWITLSFISVVTSSRTFFNT